MTRKFMTLTLALATALLAVPAFAQSDAEVKAMLQEMKDRAEIEKLMWDYARALDTRNPDAYVATFTPDGQFGRGANATKGHDALYKMVSDLRKRAEENPGPAMYHTSMNEHIEFTDKDHATVYAYWTTTFAGAKQGEPARIAAVGWEKNDLVRLNGKWLIQVRDTAPDRK
jgi:uncharacterized protein (TIGR02246 family)